MTSSCASDAGAAARRGSPAGRHARPMATLALLALAATAALALGCGGKAAPSAPRRAQEPPLCGPLHARLTGHVDAAAATELSGLVFSRSHPGVLWTHNDSGDSA